MADNNHIDVVCFGELLFDIVQGKEILGGAPMNVAYHLSKLGKTATLISKVGNDKRGRRLRDILTTKGLDTSYLQTDISHQTSIVPATPDQKGNMQYEIVENVAWDYIDLLSEYESLISKAEYFVYGSLAARSQITRRTLFQFLELPVTKVFDINLRKPFYDKEILEYLLNKSDIVKMNEDELNLVTTRYGNELNMEDKIKLLKEKFGVPTIIVTRGEAGAIACHNNTIYHQDSFPVKVVDTIGSGDSFLAAFISKLMDNGNVENALSYGCKMGAFVASREGGCPEYQLSEIGNL